MKDIVEKLRSAALRRRTEGSLYNAGLMDQSADEIERLERIISKAGDALTTPYANDEERVENARRILEQG